MPSTYFMDGPLDGQMSVTVLIEAENVIYLGHASDETGYSIERLAEISVNEAALDYARTHNLFERSATHENPSDSDKVSDGFGQPT